MRNLAFFTIALAFLTDIAVRLSKQLQADIKEGKIVLDDQILELKKEIVGGGEINLLTAATERIDGICSFDKNKLQSGRAFLFDQISVCYATDAASGKEGELEYDVKAPVALQNALFVITQDGREVLRMPVRDVHNIETGQNISDAYRQLKTMRYLSDERNIKLTIIFPEDVVLSGAAKHYVYVRLNGVQTTKKVD